VLATLPLGCLAQTSGQMAAKNGKWQTGMKPKANQSNKRPIFQKRQDETLKGTILHLGLVEFQYVPQVLVHIYLPARISLAAKDRGPNRTTSETTKMCDSIDDYHESLYTI